MTEMGTQHEGVTMVDEYDDELDVVEEAPAPPPPPPAPALVVEEADAPAQFTEAQLNREDEVGNRKYPWEV